MSIKLPYFKTILLALAFFSSFSSCALAAGESQVLSVTPPLFQLSTLPGGIWQSSVKVVNSNAYPLAVYVEVVNFAADGTAGQGKFIPVPEGSKDKATFAEWITVQKGPYVIEPEQTKDITFFAEIPENAAPGGHYAALLVSTEEPKKSNEIAVSTTQAVTSLLFMRVEGDVIEEGDVREFRTTHSFMDTTDAEFLLRFENKGNVHLQPRGDIVITNMWGTERGKIPVNYQTHFGNVLPDSIRNFSFSWKTDFEFTDIGRYKAIVTLAYGENGVKSTSSTAYFWIIPVKWTLITLSVLALFIWLIVLMVRAYVRRMLALAGVDVEKTAKETYVKDTVEAVSVKPRASYRTVSAPIRNGVIDLRKQLDTAEESLDFVATILRFIASYKIFFASVLLLVGIFITVTLYIGKATSDDNTYQVGINEGDRTTTLTEDDVKTIIQE